MEKQVLFRDRQELQAADLNGIGLHASDAMQHIVQDAVSGHLHFTGGLVSAKSATEVDVAALRFFNAGKVYASEQTETLNLFQYLPLVTKKCVAVVVWGEETDTNVEPRDFLVDLTTGATEPQAVAMTRMRVANINLQPGTESVDPQPPVIQTTTLAIAYVYLGATGIERVEMLDRNRLPQLRDHEVRLFEQEAWRAQAEPRISSIATDLAALANKTDNLVSKSTVVELASDLARAKARLNLPSAYASYEAEYFGDSSLSDENAIGYDAMVKNGLLFPLAAVNMSGLQLLNPYDPAVTRHADELLLPAYTNKARVKTTGYSGDISISQYQVQTQQLRSYTYTTWDYHYGWNFNFYTGWYNSWYWHYHGYSYAWASYYGYYTSHTETAYSLETVTTSYNGAIIGQTFLSANAMWLTKVGLQFTQIGAAGDVVIAICETDGGKPDLLTTVTRVTLSRDAIKRYPTETEVPVPPVYLDAGKRYALVLITGGDHRVATVSGNEFTQGTLFFGTDGDYFTGDLTKDLMFTLYAASFAQPRSEVMLQSVSLAGGLSDLAISAPQVVPQGCEIQYEIQVNGKWHKLGDPAMRLSTQPDLVPMRMVLLGTQDMAPAVRLWANAITSSRPDVHFTHFSKPRVLASASSAISVQVVVAQWDAAQHTIACSLLNGGTTYTPATTVVKDEPDGQAKRFTFTFAPAPGINSYQIKLEGARSPASKPYVIVERTDVAS